VEAEHTSALRLDARQTKKPRAMAIARGFFVLPQAAAAII
jgi:hypothetical protein